MSLLIQLRYRIKAIDTIKKITHAMRLISMSSRSRLKSKEEPLRSYIKTSHDLLARLQVYAPEWKNPILHPPADTPTKQLIILIGSQRGLCGNFNTTLFHFFDRVLTDQAHKDDQKINLIPIGKKAINYLEENPRIAIIQQYTELNARTIPAIAHELTEFIFSQERPFTRVDVLSNQLKTFFIQKPHDTQLIPFESAQADAQKKSAEQDQYQWDQSPSELLDQLARSTIESELHYLLFESLLAEHAARFISMDNATRNAQTLLEETQLQYNKLRQAKITKELTELVSNI